MTRVKKKNNSGTEERLTTSDSKHNVTRSKTTVASGLNLSSCERKKKSKKTSSDGSKITKTEKCSSPVTANQGIKATVLDKQKRKPMKRSSTKKTEANLRPSDIRYSQSSISSQFKDGSNIGQLLDDIYFGRCFASALPQIEVSHIKGQWVSADNRRLWVFKQLELLGRVDLINVKVSKTIYVGKLTSENAGKDVEIRNGDPSGVVYALLVSAQNQDTDDDLAKVANDPAPENKGKRKRRRRRKPKTRRENSSNTEQNIHQTKGEITSINHFETESTDTDYCQDNPFEELETLLLYNQDLEDENTYYEEYVYHDSDNWTDPSGTAVNGENDVSKATPDSYWEECEKLLNMYHVETVLSKYTEIQTSSDDSDHSDIFDVFTNTCSLELDTHLKHHDRFSRRDFEKQIELTNDSYPKNYYSQTSVDNDDFGMPVDDSGFDHSWDRDFKKQDELRTASYPNNYYSQTSVDNDFGLSVDESGFGHWWDRHQAEPNFGYTSDVDSELCNKYECVRCTRMMFYRELDKGPYNEPSCQCTTRNRHHPFETGETRVKNNFKDNSILSKVSRSLGGIAGFFNKIFS